MNGFGTLAWRLPWCFLLLLQSTASCSLPYMSMVSNRFTIERRKPNVSSKEL
jgi:hypothetical protein